MKLNMKQEVKLKGLFDALMVFKSLDENMNLNTMLTAIEVARRGDAGVSVSHMMKLLDISNASASRNMAVLEPKSARNPKGLGYAMPAFDPNDARGKLRVATDEMEGLVTRLCHALGD